METNLALIDRLRGYEFLNIYRPSNDSISAPVMNLKLGREGLKLSRCLEDVRDPSR